MSYNNPDAFPGESDEEYELRTREESQDATGLMFGIAALLFFALKIAATFGIFIYTGYLLSQRLWGEETSKLKIWSLALLFIYLIFCGIYFFKGIIIGLRAKNRKLWILPWALCVLICCIVPALVVKSAVGAMFDFGEQQGIFYIGISWGAFILSAFYLYGIYQFKTASAPRFLYWSYAWGLKVSL